MRRHRYDPEPGSPELLTLYELVDLLFDVQEALERGVADPRPYEAALAELEAEAARRKFALPCVPERRLHPRHRITRLTLEQRLEAMKQAVDAGDMAGFSQTLWYLGVPELWIAFCATQRIRDPMERLLALRQVAFQLDRRIHGDEAAIEGEALRTEGLSEAAVPFVWLEQLVLAMFHRRVLLRGGFAQ